MICFDFDGVIADTLEMWEEACRLAASEQGLMLGSGVRPFARLCPLTFVQLAQNLGLEAERFDQRMAELGREIGGEVQLFPGMDQAISEIARHWPLCVISASRTAFIEAFLERHGLRPCFGEIYGGDRHNGKSALLRALPDALCMIGDAKSDLDAARSADVPSVGVLWGWQDRDMLQGAGSIAADPSELLQQVTDCVAMRQGSAQNPDL